MKLKDVPLYLTMAFAMSVSVAACERPERQGEESTGPRARAGEATETATGAMSRGEEELRQELPRQPDESESPTEPQG